MSRRPLSLAVLVAFLLAALPVQATTVPDNLMYEGRILDSSRNPVTASVVFRFSLWKGSDWVSGDTVSGSINTASSSYGGWYETQTVTPNSNGMIQVLLGSSAPLPTMDFTQHKYLQVEVKSVGSSDSSYVLLDPTGDSGADTNDRKIISSVAYAKNTESVQNRVIGTSSGNVLILGSNGRVNAAQMGSGTTARGFTINASNTAGDTTLTFGHSLLPATIIYSNSAQRFEFSADVKIQGNLTVTGLINCDSIDTNGSGALVCGTDSGAGGGLSRAEADPRYVKKQGDAMTGTLTIKNGAGLTASGSIATEQGITINKDNAASDAVLTFGNSLGAKTMQYSNANQQFEFNDDVAISGNLTVTGRMNGAKIDAHSVTPLQVSSGAGLSVSVASGSYRLGNSIVQFAGSSAVSVFANATNYIFFGSGGLTVRTSGFASQQSHIPVAVVLTNSSGIQSISDRRVLQSDTREHDVVTVLTPEFDKATYQGDGSDNVGRLTMAQDNTTKRNYYLWSSTRTTLQDYDIFVKVLVPQDFVRWKSNGMTNPVLIHYRSTTANASDNALDVTVYDTNGTPVTLSGTSTGLASTSWTASTLSFMGTPTWTPGQEFLMKFHLSSKNASEIHVGSLELNYTSLTGQ